MKKIPISITLVINLIFTQDHWETAVFANDYWKYSVPNSEPDSNWNKEYFDDNNWNEGPGGFGYGDGDDGTIIDQTLSVYFRATFNVEEKTKLKRALISADYDDGFIAYLNGIEVARSYNLPEPGTFVPFDFVTYYDHEALFYNGDLPESIMIDSLSLDSILIYGLNVFAVQVHNVSETSSDLSGNFYLTFGVSDGSQFFSEPPSWFQEPVIYEQSHLPIIKIDTYGIQIPDEPRIPAYMGIINNETGTNNVNDNFNDYDGHITIERRGNSSQGNEKTPYRFETVDEEGDNRNVKLLGMPEENDWVLYAPWQDKTMIRNVLIYQLSNDIGRYASRTRFAELFLNDEYMGVYVLMEKIKRDNNRIDISKLNPDEIEGDDITGGYILKFDWNYTGGNLGGFDSEYDGNTYNYHYPKPSDIVLQQEEYIQNYVTEFENVMLSDDYTNDSTGYPKMTNVESFVDFILLQELAKNVDAYRLSTYIYKDKESVDNRLTAGPIWDFNHGFGNCDYGETWKPENWLLEFNPEGGDQMSFWWNLLWQDENFKMKISQRYSELRSSIFSEQHIFDIIDDQVTYLGEAIDRNFSRWPILGNYIWPNYYVFDTYEEEVSYLKSWTTQRLTWMDNEILQLKIEEQFNPSVCILEQAYPNPFNPNTNIVYKLPEKSNVRIIVYDVLGKEVKILVNGFQNSGSNIVQWNATNGQEQPVSAGLYFYSIDAGLFKQTKKMILLK